MPDVALDTSARPSGQLVLLIEDNDDHAELLRRALLNTGLPHELLRLEDGEQALGYLLGPATDLASRADCALILLDLRLPRVDGLEVLQELRRSGKDVRVPVVILTTSEADADIAAAYEHGAHAYVVKPADFTSFGELARDVARFWLGWNKTPLAG
ncbi:MAG TPA: response regulator [Polyangiales bacterium]|nr:response regulator [Polyangiales bacterium]